MRDKNLTLIQFVEQYEKFVNRKLKLPELLRTAVIDSPTFTEDYKILIPRNFRDLRALVAVHWYFPGSLFWYYHLELKDCKLNHLNFKQKVEINLMLESREIMLYYLYRTKRLTSFEIFGNILGTAIRNTRYLKVFKRSKKIINPIRKRGYDDKGSLRLPETWLPDYDFSLTEQQNRKELRSYLTTRKIDSIKKYLEKNLSRE
jgi:hypothetical protein